MPTTTYFGSVRLLTIEIVIFHYFTFGEYMRAACTYMYMEASTNRQPAPCAAPRIKIIHSGLPV